MRVSFNTKSFRILLIFVIGLVSVSTVPLLSKAEPSSSVSIVNNSSRPIEHVYFSHVGADDWSGNVLESEIGSGQSSTISNFSCDAEQMRVIGEDVDGCFLYSTVTCGSSTTWTITNSTARDCGNSN